VEGFEACHIWPRTCYDERFHTAIANLVLLPRALAGLSDHDPEIQASLQYRAHEPYSWYPDGADIPQRPAFYPSRWPTPEPPSAIVPSYVARSANRAPNQTVQTGELAGMSAEERGLIIARLREWASRPHLVEAASECPPDHRHSCSAWQHISLPTRRRNRTCHELQERLRRCC
jgi:hypothetical protein